MEYGKIFLEITNISTEESGPQWHVIITGIVDQTLPITQQEAHNLGSRTCKTKSGVIDFIIEKVEE